jgi:DHA2 family multidrug resistance protein
MQLPLTITKDKLSQFLTLMGLAIGMIITNIDMTVANVSIPYIAGDMAVSVNEGTYIITSYCIGEALSIPLTGWLTKRIGDIRLILFSLFLFIIFSCSCAIAWNMEALVLFRFFQGFVGGPFPPLCYATALRFMPEEKRGFLNFIFGTAIILSWTFGPLLGGWITTHYSWPWIFYINLPIGFFCILLIFYELWNQDTPIQKEKMDWLGFLLLCIGVTSWQIFLDKGQLWDWWNSSHIRTLFSVSIVSLSFLLSWELFLKKPFLALRFFKKRSFTISTLFTFIFIPIDLGALVLLPLWRQSYCGYDAFWAAMTLIPFSMGAIIFALISEKLIEKLGIRCSVVIASLLGAISCFLQAYELNTDVSLYHMWFPRILLGGGTILNVILFSHYFTQDLELKDFPSATSLIQFLRALFAALGISFFITLWERRTVHHRHDLIENITSFQPNTENLLTSLQQKGMSHTQAVDQINLMVDAQAATLSLNDCFLLMGWLFLVALLVVPFIKLSSKSKVEYTVDSIN